MTQPRLEVWADSFKEGEWFVESLLRVTFDVIDRSYRFNFQPTYRLSHTATGVEFGVVVYGDYDGWTERPDKVTHLLNIGRPDVILLDPGEDSVLLAVEETAAVPTGNQSLQRLERVWWSAEAGVPFAYLIGEYGLHIDGGLRHSSIWPSYLGLKLSMQYQVPSVTLMYGDKEHPTSYDAGLGLDLLAKLVGLLIGQHFSLPLQDREEHQLLFTTYAEMARFVSEHADEIAHFLPGKDVMRRPEILRRIVRRVLGS